MPMTVSFIKMHGLGNDFAIFGLNDENTDFTLEQIRKIADRKCGIGCDQLIILRPSPKADSIMEIYNPDGSKVGACGNATRCVGYLLMEKLGQDHVTIETMAGILRAEKATDGLIRVNMGVPKLEWQDIPLAKPCDTLHVDMGIAGLPMGVGINMGNPHIVFFDTDMDVEVMGHDLEHHALFPERANVSFVEVKDRGHLRLHVWERGTGITQACGSGACAVLVAAVRRDLADRTAIVEMDGGCLTIEWGADDNTIWMTGPVATVYNGEL